MFVIRVYDFRILGEEQFQTVKVYRACAGSALLKWRGGEGCQLKETSSDYKGRIAFVVDVAGVLPPAPVSWW